MAGLRSCYYCEYFALCGCRQKVEEALKKIHINIDGDSSPGKMPDIYNAVGRACLDYKRDNKT